MKRLLAICLPVVAMLALASAPSLGAERLGVCGVVKAYTAPTAAGDGTVTIGTRTLGIAAGTKVEGTHAPTLGEKRCVGGNTDSQGRFTTLSIEASLIESACGVVTAFTPASATRDGSLTLQLAARPPVAYVVPAATQLPPDFGSGQRCVALAVNAAGNAIVTGTAPVPTEGRAAAPVTSLPSTATDDGPNWALAASTLLVALLIATVRRRSRG